MAVAHCDVNAGRVRLSMCPLSPLTSRARPDATIIAAQHRDKLLADGDFNGLVTWKRIMAAITSSPLAGYGPPRCGYQWGRTRTRS